MDYPSLQSSAFKIRMRGSLWQPFADSLSVRVANHKNIYQCGDQGNSLYFIESGLVKLLMVSPEGKECLLALLSTGDVFGELSLSGASERLETATAMAETVLRKIPCLKFMAQLSTNSSSADFISYLVECMAEQKNTITSLMTVDSQHRLGEILMKLADKLGKQTSNGLLIEHRITHEELSEMVGTTRPRITEFLQLFRKLGLVELNSNRFLVLRPDRLTDYLKGRSYAQPGISQLQ